MMDMTSRLKVMGGIRILEKTKIRHTLIAYVLYKCYYAFS